MGEKRIDQKLPPRRRVFDLTLRCLICFCAGLTALLAAALILYILARGLPGVTWQLISSEESYLNDTIGILPSILNTLYIIVAALAIVLPLGVGAAVYLTEYATSKRLVRVIEFTTETLAGIPSILYGLVGMMFFCQLLRLKTSLLAGALTLGVMILPTIVRTTQESLKTVPESYREGALGLGATKWHMIRTIILPSSVDGIVTGCILAIGRIVGESAALLFTAGLGLKLLGNLFEAMSGSGATLSVALYIYAMERGKFDVAFAVAAVLMLIVLVINFAAKGLGKRLKNKI